MYIDGLCASMLFFDFRDKNDKILRIKHISGPTIPSTRRAKGIRTINSNLLCKLSFYNQSIDGVGIMMTRYTLYL